MDAHKKRETLCETLKITKMCNVISNHISFRIRIKFNINWRSIAQCEIETFYQSWKINQLTKWIIKLCSICIHIFTVARYSFYQRDDGKNLNFVVHAVLQTIWFKINLISFGSHATFFHWLITFMMIASEFYQLCSICSDQSSIEDEY